MNRAGFEPGRIGLGCGTLGELNEAQTVALVEAALSAGVTLFDTARSYGASEERLGRALGSRGFLSTKGGYGVDPVPEWTGSAIEAGIHRARRVTGRSRLDVFLLHSCPLGVLRRPGLIEALEQAKAGGLVGAIGYSGDGEPLAWAVESGRFDVVQASYSLFDQANGPILQSAKAKDMLVVAKRPLGGSIWERSPSDTATVAYAEREAAMGLELPVSWLEAAVRFSACSPLVDGALIGTRQIEHLTAALTAAAKGPLPDDLVSAIQSRFNPSWPAHI